MQLGGFIKRHLTLVGLCAVVLPLLALLGLQYQALSRLEETSPAARKLSLESRLKAVVDDVDSGYLANARAALKVSPASLVPQAWDDDMSVFRGAPAEGVKRYFIASLYSETKKGKVTSFDPATGKVSDDRMTPEMWAAFTAALHSLNLAMERAVVDPNAIEVDEKDPSNRIALMPIVCDGSRIVGTAGLIADTSYFTDTYLPSAIDASLRSHFSESELAELQVSVVDETGNRRWYSAPPPAGATDIVVPMPFVFSKWKVTMTPRWPSQDQVARRYFTLSMTLTIVMIALVAGAVVLSLRAADRELRLSEMKTDFVSNVSHELRTPLASIRVFGELMRAGRVTDPVRVHEYGELIESESRRLTQLINNILDFSRIESGRKRYEFETVNPVELVSETVSTFVPQARLLGFEVDLEAPASSVPAVRVDASSLAQALLNLLDNAVKYSGDSRRVVVRVEFEGPGVAISVIDHGIGIPPDELAQIFNRFHRVSSSLVHDVKGAGLGLALVKHIVESHGGRITVSSRPGAGSTFMIHLPPAFSHPQVTDVRRVQEVSAAK